MNIIKRDGTEAVFDQHKIIKACTAAGASSSTADNIAGLIGKDVTDHDMDDALVDVEYIQNQVEKHLQTADPDAFRRFVSYRDHRAALRTTKLPREAIGDFVFYSKYSRKGRSWVDTIQAVVMMHGRRINQHCKDNQIDDTQRSMLFGLLQETELAMLDMKVLPSMRSLQFAGAPIEQKNARLYNCSSCLINDPSRFHQIFLYLLCGCGVGYSVETEVIEQLPKIQKIGRTVHHHIVVDSIDGWSDALSALMESYFTTGNFVEFNYEFVRNEGEELKTSGGKAPGHIPLRELMEKLRRILNQAADRHLRPFEVHRIICCIAEAVMAGGIRRSSLLCIFDSDDDEMRNCKKAKEWWIEFPELAMSNNSMRLEALDFAQHIEEYGSLLGDIRDYGEPGIFMGQNQTSTNPCGEIGFDHWLGFDFCNLTEINASTVVDMDDWAQRVRIATFLGKIQSLYDDLGDFETNYNVDRNRLLGVSYTGIWDAPKQVIAGIRSEVGQAIVQIECLDFDERLSGILKVNTAARATTVKPSGTASLRLGGVSSGEHVHHSKRYFRRIKAKPNEDAYQYFKRFNPHMCYEVSATEAYTIWPMHTDGLTLDDVSAVDQMKNVQDALKHWVRPGYRRGDVHHNVSCTITVEEDEWENVEVYLQNHAADFQALSFIGRLSDVAYPNAPREAIRTKGQELEWLELARNYVPVDWSQFAGDSTIESACDGPTCEL